MNKFNTLAVAGHLGLSAVTLVLAVCAIAMNVSLRSAQPEQPPFTAHVDDDTSCEYLITREGHITPRLHADGTQVCMGEDQLMARLPDFHEPDYYVSPLEVMPPHEVTELERQP